MTGRKRTVPTFEEAVEKVIAVHRAGWKDGSKSEKDWRATLRDYAVPNPPEGMRAPSATSHAAGMEDPSGSGLPRKCGWPVVAACHEGRSVGCAAIRSSLPAGISRAAGAGCERPPAWDKRRYKRRFPGL
ncbi:MAG: hypothetical protein F4Y71_13425 [Acidobacteria bacterium]|nr:hypothetical protein [Acidobacteriota bacterium]MYG74965.1 hypothetical protein [Acidobacteriota bacterium]